MDFAGNQRVRRMMMVDATGRPMTMGMEMDTDGNSVPVYKAHTYTYDGSGNLKTDTVTDGENVWVRTFMYEGTAQTGDSGWEKQNG